jgi:glutathione peroxidase
LKGENQIEIYKWLTDETNNGWCNKEPTWNFCKYLINEEGMLTYFFKQGVSPLDKRVIEAIEK